MSLSHLRAQDCVHIADVDIRVDVNAVPPQLWMILHTNEHDQVAWRGAAAACVTFSLHPQPRTVVNA